MVLSERSPLYRHPRTRSSVVELLSSRGCGTSRSLRSRKFRARIGYHGNNKSVDDLRRAVEAGVGRRYAGFSCTVSMRALIILLTKIGFRLVREFAARGFLRHGGVPDPGGLEVGLLVASAAAVEA
jgi:hypothetical protein